MPAQPLDEKDLERKLKKEHKVLVLVLGFCALPDGGGECSSRVCFLYLPTGRRVVLCDRPKRRRRRSSRRSRRRRPGSRWPLATLTPCSLLDLEERLCLTDVILSVCRPKQHLMELGEARRSKRRKVQSVRILSISLTRILLLDRRSCLLLRWPNSIARLLLRNRMLPFSL